MTLKEEFQTRNFSIYAQWYASLFAAKTPSLANRRPREPNENKLPSLGILSMILCVALGIANIFTIHPLKIIFCALALASALFILFIEVPFLLRICPTSGKFDAFVRKITTNYLRAAAYGIMSAIQFISLTVTTSTLIVLAVFLMLTALCYLLAAIRGQAFIGSKTLGGAGVAQMII